MLFHGAERHDKPFETTESVCGQQGVTVGHLHWDAHHTCPSTLHLAQFQHVFLYRTLRDPLDDVYVPLLADAVRPVLGLLVIVRIEVLIKPRVESGSHQ